MVRVKYRYILCKIWTDQYKNKVRLPLKENELKQAVQDSVELVYGDYGLACIKAGFAIKMYNPATRNFIIRVRRRFHQMLGSSLPFITSIGKLEVGIQTLKLSGTIRSALKFLIQHDKQMLTEMVQRLQASSEMKEELAVMIEKSHKRLAKTRLDMD